MSNHENRVRKLEELIGLSGCCCDENAVRVTPILSTDSQDEAQKKITAKHGDITICPVHRKRAGLDVLIARR